MKIIGLCGGSGSGKSTVAAFFVERGVPAVDADAVYHALISHKTPCLDALCDAFGSEILAADGSLDRKRLGGIVFSGEGCEERRRLLNEISHRYVLQEVRRLAGEYEKQGYPAILFDAPLLLESGFDRECAALVCVVADRQTRIARVMARDGISEEAASRRIAAQIPDEELIRRSDDCIRNDGDVAALEEQVENIIKKYIKEN